MFKLQKQQQISFIFNLGCNCLSIIENILTYSKNEEMKNLNNHYISILNIYNPIKFNNI